jgi:hypothetical protein
MKLKDKFAKYWEKIQGSLFPWLEEELPPLTKKQKQLISILEVIRLEEFIPSIQSGCRGRKGKSRRAIARAFIAKAVYGMPTTRILLDRLDSDISLRRICGWETRKEVPSESVFSRAFAKVANSKILNKAHEELVTSSYADEIVGHVITDASAIEAREKPVKKKKKEKPLVVLPEGKKRRKKGYERELTRLQKQSQGVLSLEEMTNELPSACDVGAKTNSKGHLEWWIGYKLHMTVSDNGIPLAAILSSASLNDSQAAIPLAKLTNQRVKSFYAIMDAGYSCDDIKAFSESQGHVLIIDWTARGPKNKIEKDAEKKACKTLNWNPAEKVRFTVRTTVERVFSRLKDDFGARFVRVRGAQKVLTHLMFGLLALTADQLLKIPIS